LPPLKQRCHTLVSINSTLSYDRLVFLTDAATAALSLAHTAHDNSDEVIDRVITRRTTLHTPGGISLEDSELKQLVLHVTGAVDSVWGLPIELLCDLIGQITDA
jgi:predicted house-cleaning NTP pyrophosphatase (Maf/HAM1 superfamily)